MVKQGLPGIKQRSSNRMPSEPKVNFIQRNFSWQTQKYTIDEDHIRETKKRPPRVGQPFYNFLKNVLITRILCKTWVCIHGCTRNRENKVFRRSNSFPSGDGIEKSVIPNHILT